MGTRRNGHRSINEDLGQIGTWKNEYFGKWVLEENIYLGELGTWGNGHWCKWARRPVDIWGKRYPKCLNIPVPISPQMFANGH